MLTVLGSARRLCDGVTRREALTAGALTALGGLSLPQLLAAEARPTPRKAKHVIVLYLLGGAATQDMYDLKPDAPAEIRSAFKPVATSAPGVSVCEFLPRLAKWMHTAALVRSVNHTAGCHNPLPSYTGAELGLAEQGSVTDSLPPSMGSVCEWLRRNGRSPRRDALLPDYVYLPCYLGWGEAIRKPGPYPGVLGRMYDALYTECRPSLDPGKECKAGKPQFIRGAPRLPDGESEEGISRERMGDRRGLLDRLDRRLDAAADGYDRHRQRAFDLLTSASVRAAFDVSREPTRVREAYGPTLFGSSVLLARRLIEAGVRFVNVTWDTYWYRYAIDFDSWDTHANNFQMMSDWLLPQLDRALAALLADLSDRGLLDETLIVVTSEMGRTPRINANGGRDHWTSCYSTLLAGGGVRGGTVYGASDAQGAYVKDRPVRPADICATVYQALGIDPNLMIPDRTGRPIPISLGGEPIREVLA